MDNLVSKAKNLFETKRKESIGVLVIIAIALVGFVGYNFYQSQPKSLVSELKVEFTGYDESGTLTYNDEALSAMVSELAYQRAGFNKEQSVALAKNDPVALSAVATNAQFASKATLAKAMINSIHYEFDKMSGLKNGDEVTFTVTTTSAKSPIKAEKKTFKVENLKEYEKVTTEELLKESPVTFTGFNGYGRAEIKEASKGDTVFQFEGNNRLENLKNGDKLTLKVNEHYINNLRSKGKTVSDKKVEVTVEGLKELSDVKNMADLSKKIEDLSKSENKNSSWYTYTLEAQGSYLKVLPSGNNRNSNGQLSLVTIYKITETGTSDHKSVYYNVYGYNSYVLNDGKLDLDTASKVYGIRSEDLEGLKAQLSTEGFKEYKAQQ